MNKSYSGLILTGILLALLAGCSGSSDESASGDSAKSEAPAATAPMSNQSPAPAEQQAANPHAGMTAANPHASGAGNLPSGGKVLKAMHAGGYTYMQVENDGKQFWIASTMLNVKRNDRVRWADAAVMKDFKSSSLRRTFPEILFVSSAQIEQ